MNTPSYREAVTKIGTQGHEIYGKRYIPDSKEKTPLILFAHELSRNHESMERYAQAFAEQGINTYVFDFRGGGDESQSLGRTAQEMSIMTEVTDLEEVLVTAKQWDNIDPSKIILVGGSQGGVVAAFTAARNPDIAGLVLLYPAFPIEDDTHLFFPSKDKILPEFNYRGIYQVGKNYFTDIYHIDFIKEATKYNKPVLIMHGPYDSFVPVASSEKLQRSYQRAELVIIDTAGHNFTRSDTDFAQAMTAIQQYLQQNQLNK